MAANRASVHDLWPAAASAAAAPGRAQGHHAGAPDRHDDHFPYRFAYRPEDLMTSLPQLDSRDKQVAMMRRFANFIHANGVYLAADKSRLPAGYTYFAQFAVHDLIRSVNFSAPGDSTQASADNAETPWLDLVSLYGEGPYYASHLYERPTGTTPPGRLRIGRFNKAMPGKYAPGSPVDIPRQMPGDAAAHECPAGQLHDPILADRRNADTLILSQITALFIRLHNLVFDLLLDAGDAEPFARAAAWVTSVYRHIVWHDLIRRLSDEAVWTRHSATLGQSGPGWRLPREAAFASMRFGHTMVRSRYALNDIFNTGDATAKIGDLLRFADASGGKEMPPNEIWKIDWSRFFDTGRVPAGHRNFANPIRPAIGAELGRLPKGPTIHPLLPDEPATISLAFRSLMRGMMAGIPSGQAASRAIEAGTGMAHRRLAPEEIRAALTRIARKCDTPLDGETFPMPAEIALIAQKTPLWLYVLVEAQLVGRGDRLGPVGSDFLCHAFAGSFGSRVDNPEISGISRPLNMPQLIGLVEQFTPAR